MGKDGKEFINFFKKNKIDASGVIVDKKLYTSAGSVITDKKNNQIWGFYYGAAEKIPQTDFGKLNKKTDFLVISANHKNSFLYFQREAIKYKINYLYQPFFTRYFGAFSKTDSTTNLTTTFLANIPEKYK